MMINLLSLIQPFTDDKGVVTPPWARWLRRVSDLINVLFNITATQTTSISALTTLTSPLNTGFTGTITTAKLTPGGANGSMTFTQGVLTSQTPAT